MRRKILFSVCFFGFVPVVIFGLILFSLYLLHEKNASFHQKLSLFRKNVTYKALPEEKIQTQYIASASDGRVEVLQDFLTYYKSPLVPYAEKIVQAADKYNIDYRYLPAIAFQESILCKRIPKNSHNCFGFGIYGGKVRRFKNYEEAIDIVSKTLAEQYVGKGLEDPYDIMKKYTPSSNGSWADSVTLIMTRLESSL